MRSHKYKPVTSGRDRPGASGDADDRTRQRLIEVAGALIADRGVDRVTGKEICAKAKVNAAAINYHFGGFQGLYASVLCEAHRRLATVESLRAAVAGTTDPTRKLEAIFRPFVTSVLGPVSSSWVVQVLGREIANPSAAFKVLRQREVLPKVDIVKHTVAELMGLPVSHPSVARGCLSVMAPCLMLVIAGRRTIRTILPTFGFAPENAETVVRHMVQFALAGLSAVADDVRGAESPGV
jgi:TetR/AcrR family transcriptional regulator, regulator of cefoperazone and chloramphenicol sensitivity